MVADDDGLFAAAGYQLGRAARSTIVLFVGAALTIGLITATLNLDTSVAFLTPVLVYTARSRGGAEPALLYGCLLLSNAGSLFLPGSNLTNLIVLGHLRLTGSQFLARMWLPALAALAVTALAVAVCERKSLRGPQAASPQPARDAKSGDAQSAGAQPGRPGRPALGLGLAAVLVATVLVVTLRSPAIPVALTGAVAAGARVVRNRAELSRVAEVLGIPVLVGLFGVAVALGTLGRAWAGPAVLLSHLDGWATAVVAALSTVLVNNLPAASLLAARTPGHPFWLLIGLNLGPNLAVTGSLAWLLWLRAARSAGADPSIARASRLGAIAVPLSMAVALVALSLTGAA